MFKNHIKIAFRSLWNAKLFTSLNILGLTGGMVAAVYILLWVQNELSFDAYHKKAEQISRILVDYQVSKEETWHWSSTPLTLTPELKKLPEVELVTRQRTMGGLPIKIGDHKVNIESAVYVDGNWFKVFDYQFIGGSASDFEQGIRTIALTETKALQLFGNTEVTGKVIKINSLDYTVAAVLKNNPTNSSFQNDFFLTLASFWADPVNFDSDNNWNQFNYETFVVLRKDADRIKLGRKFTEIISNFKKDEKGRPATDMVLHAEPLTHIHFNSQTHRSGQDKGDRKTIYVFLGLALVILAVACINYVNLTTARASVRSKEVGVKKLLGAKSSNLFGQFMTESLLTCLAAFCLSLMLIYLLLPAFNSVTGRTFEFTWDNATLWYVLTGTTVVAVLLTGVYPSVLLSTFRPFDVLRGNNILGTSNGGLRKALVVVQFTVAVVFLVCAAVVFQQMKFIREKELGYTRDHVLSFRFPWNMNKKVDKVNFKEKLLSETSIADATICSQSIVQIISSTSGSFDWSGRPKDFNPTVSQIAVEDNFQKVFDIKMKAGRWFAPNSEADKSSVVLNETAVKKLNLSNPVIGQRFEFQQKKGEIIGVVKDFHFKSLRERIDPLVMFNNPNWGSNVYVKLHAGKEEQAIHAIEKVWDEMLPDYPLEYRFLDEDYNRLYKNEQRTAVLFNIFTIVAVLISCLGLFGLATFTAERRLKEIGIRKVLGASVTAIVRLLSTDFIILVLVSIVVASPIGYYFMQEWLKGFEYKIELSWMLFAGAGICAVLVALITMSYQSIKAALTNPVHSLRSE